MVVLRGEGMAGEREGECWGRGSWGQERVHVRQKGEGNVVVRGGLFGEAPEQSG
jgi:hypothetical protein